MKHVGEQYKYIYKYILYKSLKIPHLILFHDKSLIILINHLPETCSYINPSSGSMIFPRKKKTPKKRVDFARKDRHVWFSQTFLVFA